MNSNLKDKVKSLSELQTFRKLLLNECDEIEKEHSELKYNDNLYNALGYGQTTENIERMAKLKSDYKKMRKLISEFDYYIDYIGNEVYKETRFMNKINHYAELPTSKSIG